MRDDSSHHRLLPPAFIAGLRELEAQYCRSDDPILQSGFSGGSLRWRAEREPILEAVNADGDFVDVGCANGFLLESLVRWAGERGRTIIPHGVDFGARLIQLAKARMPDYTDNFHVANAWDWKFPRRYRFVYTLWDCVPESFFADYLRRLLSLAVDAHGRLIVGMYGSRSRGILPIDLAGHLRSLGFRVQGTASGGQPPITVFAWIAASDSVSDP
jgi:hypothetical protein